MRIFGFMVELLQPEALFAALTSGDVATVELYFSQRHVRENVDATEAIIARSLPGDTLVLPYGDLTPWFSLPWTFEHLFGRRSLLELPLNSGQYDVIEWLFADARDAYMSATLTRLLLRGVITAAKANDVEILEYLLSSKAWSRMEQPQRQSALNRMLHWLPKATHADIILVLIAHGADVNVELMNMAYDGSISKRQVHLLDASGFFWVGCNVLVDRTYLTRRVCFGENPELTHELIRLGVDCGKTSGYALHRAAKAGDHVMVKMLLEAGCVDVDARNRGQQTALMMASLGLQPSLVNKGAPLVTRLLLEAGADATRRDCQGRTALDHARRLPNSQDVVKILQAHEATAH